MDVDDLKDVYLVSLGHHKNFPSLWTCNRWISQYQTKGNVRSKRATGNRCAEHEVHSIDLVNPAIHRIVHPEAYIYEVIAYLNNMNLNSRPYSKSQIFRAEQRLGLGRKKASTTSDYAYLPVNLRK